MSSIGMSRGKLHSVIDGKNVVYTLPASTQRTGAIRIGRGSNTVAHLKIRNVLNGTAAIETDLPTAGDVAVAIRNVHVSNGERGIDIRNPGVTSPASKLSATLEGNTLSGMMNGLGQGIRIVNFGTAGAVIPVSLRENSATGNYFGCLVANLNSTDSKIDVDSHGDVSNDNGMGCVLLGGNGSGAIAANNNAISFTAHASQFSNNTGPLAPTAPRERGGIVIDGGTSAQSGKASQNSVRLKLFGSKVDGNTEADIAAWGAFTNAILPAGSNNTVRIDLHGKPVNVISVPSFPREPAGTNTVTVVR